MKERRSLIEGVKITPEQHEAEAAFVYGSKRRAAPVDASTSTPPVQQTYSESLSSTPPTEIAASSAEASIMPQMKGRVPVTARCRPEIAMALKQISLKRQLAGLEPYYVQEIVEEAIGNWIRDHS